MISGEREINWVDQSEARTIICLLKHLFSTKRNTPVVEDASYSLHLKYCKNSKSCFREVELCDIVTMTYDAL